MIVDIHWAAYTADPANDGKDYHLCRKSKGFPNLDYLFSYMGFHHVLSGMLDAPPTCRYILVSPQQDGKGDALVGLCRPILPKRGRSHRMFSALLYLPREIFFENLDGNVAPLFWGKCLFLKHGGSTPLDLDQAVAKAFLDTNGAVLPLNRPLAPLELGEMRADAGNPLNWVQGLASGPSLDSDSINEASFYRILQSLRRGNAYRSARLPEKLFWLAWLLASDGFREKTSLHTCFPEEGLGGKYFPLRMSTRKPAKDSGPDDTMHARAGAIVIKWCAQGMTERLELWMALDMEQGRSGIPFQELIFLVESYFSHLDAVDTAQAAAFFFQKAMENDFLRRNRKKFCQFLIQRYYERYFETSGFPELLHALQQWWGGDSPPLPGQDLHQLGHLWWWLQSEAEHPPETLEQGLRGFEPDRLEAILGYWLRTGPIPRLGPVRIFAGLARHDPDAFGVLLAVSILGCVREELCPVLIESAVSLLDPLQKGQCLEMEKRMETLWPEPQPLSAILGILILNCPLDHGLYYISRVCMAAKSLLKKGLSPIPLLKNLELDHVCVGSSMPTTLLYTWIILEYESHLKPAMEEFLATLPEKPRSIIENRLKHENTQGVSQ